MSRPEEKNRPDFLTTPAEFFRELIEDAVSYRQMKIYPLAVTYLVEVLQKYMVSDQLFEEDESGKKSMKMLAEMYLEAASCDEAYQRADLYRRLGETSLYISGFFGDSLQRKIVDLDYYTGMGESAYGSLAQHVREDTWATVFSHISKRFVEYVDVLTYISQKAMVQDNQNLLRLYERFLRTGSELAREQLIEHGIHPTEEKRSVKQ